MKPGIRLFLLLLAGILLLSLPGPEYVRAEPAGGNEDPAYTEPDKEQEANELKQEILSELDLKEVQDMLDAMLGEKRVFLSGRLWKTCLQEKTRFQKRRCRNFCTAFCFPDWKKKNRCL